MYLAEAKAKKLEPIKQCLKIWTNYQIESINDGFIIIFPYRHWLDGDGMSMILLLEDDMDTLILQDDDFCIHRISAARVPLALVMGGERRSLLLVT